MNVLVVGDSCTDKFIYGSVNRLNPEAPTQIFSPSHETENPGMAANVAEHFKNLGIRCRFLTNWENITKTRYVDEASNYILLRVDEEKLISPISNYIDIEEYDFVVVSDYNKGFLTQSYIEYLIKESCKRNKPIFLDTKKTLGKWSFNAWIKINEKEWLQNKKQDINEEKTIITLGKTGVQYRNQIVPPEIEIVARDVVGAGDTFLVFFSLYYYKTRDVVLSIKKANHFAGIACLAKGVKNSFEESLDTTEKSDTVSA